MADKTINQLTQATALTDSSLFVIEQNATAKQANWGMMKNYISPGVAAQYSTSATYNVGDYCIYNGQLYRCITAITTGEAWTAAHWTAAVLGNDVGDIKSAVIDTTNRQLKLGTLIPNTYIQSSNGAAASWNGNSATDYLPCFMAKRLITHIDATNPYAENAFYTSSKTFISSFQVLAGQHEILVPANAYYVRFSNITENIETLSVHLYETCIATIFPAANHQVEFNLSGTTIYFKVAQMIGAIYVGQNNAFNSTYVYMDSAISVPHDYWCIWNIDSNTIQAISDSNLKKIGDVRYCVLFYNSSGHVRGLFEKYVIENETDKKFSAVDILDWKSNGVCAPYGSADVSFSTSGTTITITCERYIVYSDSDHSWRMCDMTDNPTITVPHDYFVIYNYSTDKIEVKTLEQLVALPNQKYIVLFYNSSGKMCGPFEMYYSRYKISQYDKTYGAIYPNYYAVHMTTKLRIINQKLSTLSLGDAFVFITDIHYPDNKMYSPSLIRDVCNKTGINTVVLNGDYINRETNKNDALVKINRVCSYYEYPGVDTYRVVGNHEYNNPGASSDPEYIANELNASELRWSIINPNQNKIVYDTNSLSYYFDNEAKKIRYFVGAVTKTSGITSASIHWIAEQVENVPEDYGVVVFLHTELSAAGGSVHVTNEYVSSLFDAMKSKGSYDGYNYAGKNFEFVACFCGDYHLDMAYTTTNGAKIIATTCDAMTQEGNLQRTAGTYTEQAFDVVIIDRTTKKIHMVRIGAGDDRTFDY